MTKLLTARELGERLGLPPDVLSAEVRQAVEHLVDPETLAFVVGLEEEERRELVDAVARLREGE